MLIQYDYHHEISGKSPWCEDDVLFITVSVGGATIRVQNFHFYQR